MGKQTTIQLSVATQRQVADLTAAGHGGLTAIVRTAIDRMHREECGANRPRVEIWLHRDGLRYAVQVRAGRAHAAAGPLDGEAISAIQGGALRPEWSTALADDINLEEEAHGDRYRRVWAEEEGA